MLVVMFNEKNRTVERNVNSEQLNPERPNMERQMKKLVRYYANGGNWNYIFNSDEKGYREDELTSDEAREARRVLLENGGLEKYEKLLLKNIQGPMNQRGGAAVVFDGMADDKHQKRILGYMVRGVKGWELYDYVSEADVDKFAGKYKTPMDFEQAREDFLRIFRGANSEKKAQEYEEAMEEFQQRVYGKKYEYYKAMKELHKEAKEAGAHRPNGGVGKIEQIKSKFAEFFERDPVVKDAGLAMLNKGLLIGNPNRLNEDAAYYNPEMGVFGVFDGAGGMHGAALASQIARDTMVEEVSRDIPETPYELGQILTEANGAVIGKGYSTAVVGRILETPGRKALIWTSVGDSRIYIVSDGKVEQLTTDENFEGRPNVIKNALGREDFRVNYAGEHPLKDGDRVVFCSDGVTGDFEPDFIPDDEFVSIVGGAATADLAAWSLINRATKRDDRTAIVVEV